MITTVKYADCPDLFSDIVEFSIDEHMDHRRGANFFRYDIIEFKPEHKQYFSDMKNFEDYLGTWKTNTIIWDDNNGFDGETYSELTRVEQKEKVTYEWVTVANN
jgi:hypothetical protein